MFISKGTGKVRMCKNVNKKQLSYKCMHTHTYTHAHTHTQHTHIRAHTRARTHTPTHTCVSFPLMLFGQERGLRTQLSRISLNRGKIYLNFW